MLKITADDLTLNKSLAARGDVALHQHPILLWLATFLEANSLKIRIAGYRYEVLRYIRTPAALIIAARSISWAIKFACCGS